MVVQVVAQTGPAVVSALALALSMANLYLQARDRRPRLEIRLRYEYRAIGRVPGVAERPQLHDESQERLSVLLGGFLREHGLEYPQGIPLVRFTLSNKGERPIYLESLRLLIRGASGKNRRTFRVLDPAFDRVLDPELADGSSNVLASGRGGRRPVELAPGDGAGYRFELIRLANTLSEAGYTGNVRLALEAADRLGRRYRRPFEVNVDLWAYHGSAASA